MSATSKVPMSPSFLARGSVASRPAAGEGRGFMIWLTLTPPPPAMRPAETSESTNDFARPGNDWTSQIQKPMYRIS